MQAKYYTDGLNLYELVDDYYARNYGRGGSAIRYVVMRNASNGDERLVSAKEMLDMKEVCDGGA